MAFYSITGVLHHVGYLFSLPLTSLWQQTCSTRFLERSLKGLLERMEVLRNMELDVNTRIRMSENREMIPTLEVRSWLQRISDLEKVVREILAKGEELLQKYRGCFQRRNCCFSYRLQKKIAETRRQLDDLIVAGQFNVISHPLPPPQVHLLPHDETVGLEWVFENVWHCLLEEDDYGIIGLCGMGGIGKTTLLKKINNKLSQNHDFDVVIWVTVTQNGTLEGIQDIILRRVKLMDDRHENQDEKASMIYRALMEKRCVLLLDDVWERIDLSMVGVPRNSKVVLTSRSMNVCTSMNARKVFTINPLSAEQAWALFGMNVGENTLSSHTRINEIAHRVADQCNGLPLALVTLGRSMANKKNPQEWHHVLTQLRFSANDFSDFGDLFPTLGRTFDSLSTDVAKKCFLHCSLFPAESPIEKNQLIEYWIGEGFLQRKGFGHDEGDVCGEGDVARNMGHSVLGELVSACLLLDVDEAHSVKMHDLIRDMALWIATNRGEYKDKFFVQAGVKLAKVPRNINWAEAEKVSLMDNCIEELDDAIPDLCPNLSTLILSKNRFAFISNDFFKSMPSLRVLDLSWSKLEELPMAICELITLHYLNLSHTNVSRLPESIQRLENLEVFDLSYIAELYLFPSGVIPHLERLHTLNIFYCGHANWTKEGDDLCISTESFLEELEFLSSINDLGLSIKGEPALNKLQSSQKLQGCTRSLSIVQCKGLTSLPLSSIQFMTHLETLEVRNCHDLKEFKISDRFISKEYFDSLQHVKIEDCWLLEELTWLSFVPNLESLQIERCMNLKEIISVQVIGAGEVEETSSISAFLRLKRLYLNYLPDLELICRIALELPALEEITIDFCPKLKKLPVDIKSGLKTLKMIKGHRIWWDELQWEDNSMVHAFHPYFTEIEF